jgi:lipid II:glycine glycyltransferase (peptidoglycan interpeptide bridge formation enzyme)
MEIKNFGAGKRGVSLPFSDYCDPLLSGDIPLQEVLGKAFVYGKMKGWTSLEIRTRKNLPAEIPPSGSYLHHDLDITVGEENLFSRFRASNQRNIKKAAREGVEVTLQNSLDAVERYYTLHCGTRKRHGLPSQPVLFFRNIQKQILSKGNGFVALASYRGKSISGGVYIHSNEKAIFKYGASDRRYQELRANNLLMWEAIRWYSQNGFSNFSFGRTDPENEGLINYKRGWGSDERAIFSVHYDLINNMYNNDKKKLTYGLHNKIFHLLPIGISKQISKIIYKYMD